MTTFLVERYTPGLTADQLAESLARVEEEIDLAASPGDVAHLQTAYIPDEEAVLSLFEAASGEEVEELNRRAGIGFSRVVEVVLVDGSLVTEHPERR